LGQKEDHMARMLGGHILHDEGKNDPYQTYDRTAFFFKNEEEGTSWKGDEGQESQDRQ